jgi:hypothetical protein
MRLSQPQNLLKRVILAVICIIILALLMLSQKEKERENESILMTELLEKRKMANIVGAWDPYQKPLEEIRQGTEQKKAIKALLEHGFSEYYFGCC